MVLNKIVCDWEVEVSGEQASDFFFDIHTKNGINEIVDYYENERDLPYEIINDLLVYIIKKLYIQAS